MKKLLILFAAITATSISSFGFWTSHQLSWSQSQHQKIYQYYPNNPFIYYDLFAWRQGNIVDDYIMVAVYSWNPEFDVTVWAQQAGEHNHSNGWSYVGAPGYLLELQLYCPLPGDYGSAYLYW